MIDKIQIVFNTLGLRRFFSFKPHRHSLRRHVFILLVYPSIVYVYISMSIYDIVCFVLI